MHSLALYVDGRCRINASSVPSAGNGKDRGLSEIFFWDMLTYQYLRYEDECNKNYSAALHTTYAPMSSSVLLNGHAVKPGQTGFARQLDCFREFFPCDPSVKRRLI